MDRLDFTERRLRERPPGPAHAPDAEREQGEVEVTRDPHLERKRAEAVLGGELVEDRPALTVEPRIAEVQGLGAEPKTPIRAGSVPGSRASQSSAEASSPSICPASDRPYQSAAFAAALSPVMERLNSARSR